MTDRDAPANDTVVWIGLRSRAVRDALAAALALARPGLSVRAMSPRVLDAALHDEHPGLVVCERLTPALLAHTGPQIVLHRDGETGTDAPGSGLRRVAEPTFDLFMAAVDAGLREPVAHAAPSPEGAGPNDRRVTGCCAGVDASLQQH